MKLFILFFALQVMAGGLQITTGQQSQDHAAQVSGTALKALVPMGITSTRLGSKQLQDQQITALTNMMKAVNAGDASGYAKVYAQDAVITIYGGGTLTGRTAIEQYEVELLREFPGTRLAFYSVWQDGRSAVVHYGVNGRAAGGRPMGHEGLLFYRFNSAGLIENERRYLDSLTPMAQLGILGEAPARPLPTLPTRMEVHVAGRSALEKANVAIVEANYGALNSKNESSFLAAIADAAVFDELIHPRQFIGKRRVKAWLDTWERSVPDAASEITNKLAAGDYVVTESVMRGTLKGPLGQLTGSNKPFEVHRASIIQLKHGKFFRVLNFMNGKELAEAVGQWPPRQLK